MKSKVVVKDKQEVIQWVVEYYRESLVADNVANAFLAKKGFVDSKYLSLAKVGYCNRTLGSKLPSRSQAKGKALRRHLTTLGILDNNGRETFHGCVVFPIIMDDDIKGLYGHRILAPSKLRQTSNVELLVWFDECLLNQHRFSESDVVLVFDNYLDAFLFAQYGWVTTVFDGTDESFERFSQQVIKRLVMVLTNQENLAHPQLNLLNTLSQANVSVWQCRLPVQWITALIKTPKVEVTEAWIQRSVSLSGEAQLMIDKPELEALDTPILQALNQPPLIQKGDDYWLQSHDCAYRIRGLQTSQSNQLKVNLLLQTDEGLFVDSLDLYQAKLRHQFARSGAIECRVDESIIRRDLNQLVIAIEALPATNTDANDAKVTISETAKRDALDWLHGERLIEDLQTDLQQSGLIGEAENGLLAYLACVSRLLVKPIAVLVQSASSAGKSSLMEGVMKLFPKEATYNVSTLTGQSLYYMGRDSLKHKILAIAEDEGLAQASYALKLLQSQGEVTIASTVRSKQSGKMSTEQYTVEGPIMLFLTTTAIHLDEELVNRCLVLTVNESQAQTQSIHRYQRYRKTLEGWKNELTVKALVDKHQTVQRLLKPYKVINPFAEQLAFIDHQTRSRRDHEKYLSLIDSIALLHQYQREIKQLNYGGEVIEYIEVTREDIQIANRLAVRVFSQTLDELPPQTRRCLTLITDYVTQQAAVNQLESCEVFFTRREVREFTHWSHTQVHIHCKRLEAMEYLKPAAKMAGKGKYYQLISQPNHSSKQTIEDTLRLPQSLV